MSEIEKEKFETAYWAGMMYDCPNAWAIAKEVVYDLTSLQKEVEQLREKLTRHKESTKLTEGELLAMPKEDLVISLYTREHENKSLQAENEQLRKDKKILHKQYHKRGKIMQDWIEKYNLPIAKVVLDEDLNINRNESL